MAPLYNALMATQDVRSCGLCARNRAFAVIDGLSVCPDCALGLGEPIDNLPGCLTEKPLGLPEGDFSPLDVPPVEGQCLHCGHTGGWTTVQGAYGLCPRARCRCCGHVRRLLEWPIVLERWENPGRDTTRRADWKASRRSGRIVPWEATHPLGAHPPRIWQDDEEETSEYPRLRN